MRDWLSCAELADLALPGLPDSKRGWNEYVDREGWLARKDKARLRKGKGGGLEYHVELLPPAALACLAARAIGAVDLKNETLAAAAADPKAAQLTLPALESRDARLALIAAADRFARNASLSRRTADAAFCALYALDRLAIEPWIRRAVKRLSARTLMRWRAELKFGSASRLGVDRGAARRGKGALATAEGGEAKRYVLALVAHQPHLSADHVRECVAAKFAGFEPPPVRTFQHFLKGLKASEGALLAKITNPDAFKSRFRLSGTNSHPVSRLNELWMIDASPADALCVDGRHSLYVCVDIFSRRLSVQVTRTPRAESVALLMRRAILSWGVPERVKTDNGSDFKAKATQRLFASLRIETEASTPFSPEQKGHVERAIGTLQRDLMPLLPGFIGHSVKDRKVIEERKAFSARLGESDADAFCVELKAAELQRYCNDWADDRYAHRPHDGLSGATPFATAAAYPGQVKRIDDVRALDLLLAPIAGKDGLRTVGKTGLRIDHSFYIFAAAMPGTSAFVRMDPSDMGRAYVFEPDGETYLGEAVCPELAGVDPAEAVARARAEQKKLLEEGAKELRADMRKIKPRDLAAAVLGRAAENAAKIVAFPRAHEGYSTPALEAAGEARRGDGKAPEAIEPITGLPWSKAMEAFAQGREWEAERAELRAEVERDIVGAAADPEGNVEGLRARPTPAQKMALVRDVDARLRRGEPVGEAEKEWFHHFRRQPEYLGGLDSPSERYRHARFVRELIGMNVGPLWPTEERWYRDYAKTSEFAAYEKLYEDFGEGALR
ncbi:MAG: DDE-type integrase/transposase/recombinase [Roseiarcus sp.]